MKNTFLLFALGMVVCGCGQSQVNEEKAIKDTPEKVAITAPTPASVDEPQNLAWVDTLITTYIRKADNQLIKYAVKNNLKEEWLFDQSLKTDTATYLVFNIGHDVAEADGSEPRFVSDSWLYIDSLSRKVYEQDNEKLVEWKNTP